MQRVMIIGSCGAGKTTLARQVANITGLPLIHLDAQYWLAGWVEPDKQLWRNRVESLAAAEEWLIDGNYSGTMQLRLDRADTVIFLDFNRFTCLWQVLKRYFKYKGQNRPDMATGCPEKIDWEFIGFVWSFPYRSRPGILNKIRCAGNDKQVVVLKSRKQVELFLNTLRNA